MNALILTLLLGGITDSGYVPYSTALRYVNISEDSALVVLHNYNKSTLDTKMKELRAKFNKNDIKVVIGELNIGGDKKLWATLRQPEIPCIVKMYYNKADGKVYFHNSSTGYIPVKLDIPYVDLIKWYITGRSNYSVRFGLCPQKIGIPQFQNSG